MEHKRQSSNDLVGESASKISSDLSPNKRARHESGEGVGNTVSQRARCEATEGVGEDKTTSVEKGKSEARPNRETKQTNKAVDVAPSSESELLKIRREIDYWTEQERTLSDTQYFVAIDGYWVLCDNKKDYEVKLIKYKTGRETPVVRVNHQRAEYQLVCWQKRLLEYENKQLKQLLLKGVKPPQQEGALHAQTSPIKDADLQQLTKARPGTPIPRIISPTTPKRPVTPSTPIA